MVHTMDKLSHMASLDASYGASHVKHYGEKLYHGVSHGLQWLHHMEHPMEYICYGINHGVHPTLTHLTLTLTGGFAVCHHSMTREATHGINTPVRTS